MELSSALVSPLAFLLVLLTIAYRYYKAKHRDIPPGPRGIPLLGYAPFFGPNPQDTFLELGKRYGSIFSLYMGPKLAIVLNDYESIKTAYVGPQADVFLARADGFIVNFLSTGSDGKIHGIARTEGEPWKITRRFMLQTFRDLGMGKSTIQERILDEANYLSDVFLQKMGKPFDPSSTLYASVSNVISALCFGKRFAHDDPVYMQNLTDARTVGRILAQAGALQSYPILRFFPGSMARKWREFLQAYKRAALFVKDEVSSHEYSSMDQPRDYIDAFLQQQEKEMEINGEASQNGPFSHDDLWINLRAFFGAGTETTATTMLWLFLFMLHHPEIQQKVQSEVDDKIGRDRPITVDDRVKVPYLEAVIREGQRFGNVAPFGLLRSNTKETTLMGFRIPKRSFIVPNFKAVNVDPNLWDEPFKFKPERFLNDAGKLFEPPYFMPFSTGKRACVGESLARMEIFLFFANVMQRFRLISPEGAVLPRTDQYTTGVSCSPLPYHMEIQAR